MFTRFLPEFTLKYEVKAEDIACGIQDDCQNCPQANAIFWEGAGLQSLPAGFDSLIACHLDSWYHLSRRLHP